MGLVRVLATVAALAVSSEANAANFLAYTFTGYGSGFTDSSSTQAENVNSLIPLASFSVTIYVSLDNGSNCKNGGASSGGCYEGNGVNNYFIAGPEITEFNRVMLNGGTLTASDEREYLSDYNLDISANFSKSPQSFADLGQSAKFLNGGFSYSNIGRRYSEGLSGTLTGFSVQNVTEPGPVNVFFQAVPEPATWTMMIAGFGIVGIGLRRRKNATVRLSRV